MKRKVSANVIGVLEEEEAVIASVHNLETALKAKKVLAKVLLINCPVVSMEH